MSFRVWQLAWVVPVVLFAGCSNPSQGPAASISPVPIPLNNITCSNPAPQYPDEARRTGAKGRVVVSAAVEIDGTISNIRLLNSSGNVLLDNAALATAQTIKCTPYFDSKTGKAERVVFTKPYIFKLDDAPSATKNLSSGLTPELAQYAERVRKAIKSNLVFPDNLPDNINAVVLLSLAPDGSVLRSTIEKPSGVQVYDDAVLRAIERSSPLPRQSPEKGAPGKLRLSFRPK